MTQATLSHSFERVDARRTRDYWLVITTKVSSDAPFSNATFRGALKAAWDAAGMPLEAEVSVGWSDAYRGKHLSSAKIRWTVAKPSLTPQESAAWEALGGQDAWEGIVQAAQQEAADVIHLAKARETWSRNANHLLSEFSDQVQETAKDACGWAAKMEALHKEYQEAAKLEAAKLALTLLAEGVIYEGGREEDDVVVKAVAGALADHAAGASTRWGRMHLSKGTFTPEDF